MFIFLKNNTLFREKNVLFFLETYKKKKRPMMGNLVVIGLVELRPYFGACEQFIGRLSNNFLRL